MEPINFHRGFSLVELLVVLAIIGIVMSIVVTSQSSFNKTLILQNSTYDIALTLRDAETYGLSSRASGTTANAGYGVHFEKGTPSMFTFFADTYPSPNSSNCHGVPSGGVNAPDAQPGNCVYTAGQDQKVTEYTLGNGITVGDFCAFDVDWSCAYAQGGSLSSLDIVFARPNPDAFIRANDSANGSQYTSACLKVISPQGGARFISVAASGQITAKATSCP